MHRDQPNDAVLERGRLDGLLGDRPTHEREVGGKREPLAVEPIDEPSAKPVHGRVGLRGSDRVEHGMGKPSGDHIGAFIERQHDGRNELLTRRGEGLGQRGSRAGERDDRVCRLVDDERLAGGARLDVNPGAGGLRAQCLANRLDQAIGCLDVDEHRDADRLLAVLGEPRARTHQISERQLVASSNPLGTISNPRRLGVSSTRTGAYPRRPGW